MESIMIVKAVADDVSTLQSLAKQTFLETFAEYNTEQNLAAYMRKAFSIKRLLAELHEPLSQWYFAMLQNEKAGFLKVNFGNAQTELRDASSMEVERIYVLRKFQGNNIGKLLLEEAIAIARQHGVHYIWLGVWEKNVRAISFYKKLGFIRFGQHSFFVGDDEQTDWLMKLNL